MENRYTSFRQTASLLVVAIIALSFGLNSSHAGVDTKKQVRINFVDYGAIVDWRAKGDKALLIKTADDKWYRAAFRFPCLELPFAETIGFVTSPKGQLNRFSSVIARNEYCRFDSLEEIAEPSAPGTD